MSKVRLSLLLLMALLPLSCVEKTNVDTGQSGEALPQHRHVVFCLFDISGSTSEPAIRERYLSSFSRILDGLGEGDYLSGDVVTENSLATASYPVRADLPVRGRLDNPLMHKKRMEAGREGAMVQVKVLLESEPAESTDLLNAFLLAEKFFTTEASSTAGRKALVAFPDMIVQNPRYDFTGIDLTEERTAQLIEAERTGGYLPDLSGVEVWVVGATAAVEGGLSPAKIRQIESFWLTYFPACGANMPTERYGPALLRFELAAVS